MKTPVNQLFTGFVVVDYYYSAEKEGLHLPTITTPYNKAQNCCRNFKSFSFYTLTRAHSWQVQNEKAQFLFRN